MIPKIKTLIENKSVIAVLRIERREDAVPLAGALLEGGINVLEVTLRSDVALDAAHDMIEAFPRAVIGIGTVLDAAGLSRTCKVGGAFAVSPGLTKKLSRAAAELAVPFLPGVATVSEVMVACESGFDWLKLFPAAALGGVSVLKALAPLFPDVRFCPTGGVTIDNFADYLELENVFAVGGSWLAPEDLVTAQDWGAIVKRAQIARKVMDRLR